MAKPARTDTRYLEKHGAKWRVCLSVPRGLQAIIGTTKLKHTLETDSLAEANRLKWQLVAEFQRQIEVARNPLGTPESLLEEAKRISSLRKKVSDDEEEGLDAYIVHRVEEIAGKVLGQDRHGEALYAPEKETAAQTFAGIATGQRTP
ncbi:MAG: DUF6538 domain-containing protein, partial [Allorhizobium sp.]